MTSSSDSPGLLRKGTTVGDTYEVCEEIGRGGMGVVYEVRHKRLPQHFAIKVIGKGASEESLLRFRLEAEIISRLAHANILQIIDFNLLPDSTPYMVMEFLEGEDLERGLAKGPVSISQGLSIASQIGSALQAAHDQGIVHRDLKPANVFLSEVEVEGKHSYHVTVLDFGVSKVLDSTTLVTHGDFVVGTPQYMAPEQASGDKENISAQSDQFSMACVVYEMMCGEKAFEGQQLADVVYQVCHQDPPSLLERNSEIPIAISRAVERGMSKEPSCRFTNVLDFVEALHGKEVAEKKDVSAAEFKRASLDALPDTVVGSRLGTDTQSEHEVAATVVSRNVRTSVDNKELIPEPKQGEEETSGLKVIIGFATLLSLVGLTVVLGARFYGASPSDSTESSHNESVRSERENAVTSAADSGVALEDDTIVADSGAVVVDSGAVETASPDAMERGRSVNRETKPVSDNLAQARRMLKEGEYVRARKIAKTVLRTRNAGEGFVVTVKSFCGEGKQGTAQDWLARVPRAKRKSVISYCRKTHQVELVNL